MTLELLLDFVSPPKSPTDPGKGRDWSEVERSLDTTLPTDYKEFVNLLGTGELAGCIWVYNPFANVRDGQNLLVRVSEVLEIWRQTRADYGETECPYPLYPEPDGLLPWGHVDTGSELFWQTSGRPDEWTVVVNESRGPEFERFNKSMTGFLVSLFSGSIRSDVLPISLQRKRKKVDFIRLDKLNG